MVTASASAYPLEPLLLQVVMNQMYLNGTAVLLSVGLMLLTGVLRLGPASLFVGTLHKGGTVLSTTDRHL